LKTSTEPDSLESLFTISCHKCGGTSAALKWSETPICGDLPVGQFQCPKCGYAFRRQRFEGDPWRRIDGELQYRPIDLIPVDSRL